MLLLWLAAHAQADSAVAELHALQSGQLLLRDVNRAEGKYTPALMHGSKVHFDIAGLVATVRVTQSFRNVTDQYVEGVYGFPLPDEAAVRYMEMRMGERRIVGRIREKSAAREEYRAAKQAGQRASLVEQQRPNLFSSRVANIAPGEDVVVMLEYVQPVAFAAGVFSLRFPTTITPRYMPGRPLLSADEEAGERTLHLDVSHGWAVPTDEVPDAHAISPPLDPRPGSDQAPLNPLEITVSLDAGMPLASVDAPYHDIALTRRAVVYSIGLAHGAVEMNRDFLLNWQPVTGESPQAALFTERVGNEYFGLLMLLPPSASMPARSMAREVVFVVDTSGSMGGVSIEQARASVAQALGQLRPEDHFNVIAFNSSVRRLNARPVPATRHHLQRAQEFVRMLSAGGGTEMLPALRAALPPGGEHASDARRLRQVIFITDGAVGNEDALFREITQQLADTRLFTVGIGSAPNSWFMRRAAEFGRGSHTHIGNIDEVGEKMAALFAQLSRPAGVNLAVNWPQTVEAWPARIPDLYHGEALSVAVRFGEVPPAGEVLVSGETGGQPWSRRISVAGAQAEPRHAGIASLWARRKISALLDEILTERAEELVREEVLPLALDHRLLSPYTSFVAVEEVPARPVAEPLRSAPVANTAPQGQSAQQFAYPATATTGPAKAWFALLALFLAVLLRLVRGPEVDRGPENSH
tara:strand:+ start:5678 stop:7768 length:2091 start_codon:yes stop_codon:yes gene_type:complete